MKRTGSRDPEPKNLMITRSTLNTSALHDYLCPDGHDCRCVYGASIMSIEIVINDHLKSQFDAIQGDSCLMFHGTDKDNVPSIIADGFNPDRCTDPSFGFGTYLILMPSVGMWFWWRQSINFDLSSQVGKM